MASNTRIKPSKNGTLSSTLNASSSLAAMIAAKKAEILAEEAAKENQKIAVKAAAPAPAKVDGLRAELLAKGFVEDKESGSLFLRVNLNAVPRDTGAMLILGDLPAWGEIGRYEVEPGVAVPLVTSGAVVGIYKRDVGLPVVKAEKSRPAKKSRK